MLGTRERTLLLEALRPPDRYRLRRAVGTSYTLDLRALLTAPLAFASFDAHDEDGVPSSDPVALLEALRRHAERITIFCQAGAITVPPVNQGLLPFLEGSVIEVQSRRPGRIFHPKIWVLAFASEEAPTLYRVLCLSRNLTFDPSWDTCLQLEGTVADGQRDIARNQPLGAILEALPSLAVRSASSELRRDIRRMARDVRRVNFEPPNPFRDFRVHCLGLDGESGWPFPEGGRSLVVSPFLATSTVRRLARRCGLEILISRPEGIYEIVKEGSEIPARKLYVLSPGARLDARDGDAGEISSASGESRAADDRVDLAGLHAKLFLFEGGRDARLFTGSANATRAAFDGNVEVLIELVGRTEDCGIDAFVGSEDDHGQDTIRSLLEEYHLRSEPPDDDLDADLRMEVERLARAVGSVRLRATVSEAEAGEAEPSERWDIALTGNFPDPDEGAKVTVTVWPATMPPDVAVPVGPGHSVATFTGLSFGAITAFFAFEVLLENGKRGARKRFVVTATLVGAPEDRKERLVRSVLRDGARVLQLLLLMLSGGDADLSAFLRAGRRGGADQGLSFAGWSQAALLEALLWSLSHDPTRIDDVAGLISDLRKKNSEEKNVLPQGLDEIWAPVWEAREAMRR